MSNVETIHNWLVAGGSSEEGRQFLFEFIQDKNLIRIFSRKTKYQDQIIRRVLAYKYNWKRPEEIKFRDEFPYLDDIGCPPELKILATDKITTYKKFKDAHKALFDCTTNEQQYLTAKLVIENYIDNTLNYNELKYYHKHKKLLGKHPIFASLNRLKELRRSSPIELIEKQTKLKQNIWRIESELKKGDKPHLQVEREQRLKLRLAELEEVERLIESYR